MTYPRPMWGRILSLGVLVATLLGGVAGAATTADHLHAGDGADLGRCATAEVGAALAGLPSMSAEDRHATALAFDPLYRVWLDQGGISWLDGDVRAAQQQERATCFGPEDIEGGASYELMAESEHFALFRRSGAPSPQSLLDNTLSALEDALAELTALGWRRPAGIDELQIMVFLDALPAGLGGYTWVQECPEIEGGSMDWIVLSEDWAGEPTLRLPLAAHELFHGVQRRYAYDEYVTNFEESPSRWWVEASAVYQEGLVFPDELALAEVRSAYWGVEPWKSLFLFDEAAMRHYDVFVFPLSVEATLEDTGWHQRFWEQLDGRSGFDLRAEFDTFLAPEDTSFDTEFSAYMARAAEMDLPRYDSLYGPRDLQAFYGINGGLAGRYAATELPVEGALEAGDQKAPQALGGNYVWFGTTASPEERALEITFEGDLSTPEGEPVRWALEIVAARAGAMEQRAHLEPGTATRKGVEVAASTVLVHGVKESVDGVWLIATRLDESGGSAPGWRWEGRLVRGGSELLIEEGEGGCGCGAGTGTAAPFIVVGLLPLFGWRRRT